MWSSRPAPRCAQTWSRCAAPYRHPGCGCAPAADRPPPARRCGRAPCERGAECCRATSAAPPHFAEAPGGGRRQIALAQPRPQRADVHGSGNARIQPEPPGAPRKPPAFRPFRTAADGSSTRRRRGTPAFSRRFRWSRASAFFTSERSSSSILRNVDLDRTHLGARATEAGSERQPGLVRDAHELRRDDGADGPRVDPRKTVAADLAVHRAGVQTGAAANAVKRLPLAAVGQQPRAAVIEQHHVEFVGAVDLAAAPRAAEKRRVDGEQLAGAAAAEEFQERPPGPARAESSSRFPQSQCGSWARRW
jgi:hypothetical protein